MPWTKADLPRPTRDLDRARSDIDHWGYALLEDALPPDLNARCLERLEEQAAAEIQLGEAFEDGGPAQQWGAFRDEDGKLRPKAFTAANGGINQRVWMLPNKGACFVEALAQREVLALVGHVLGDDFLLSVCSANIAKPGGVRMPLHTDQWWAPEPTRSGRRNLPVGSIQRTKFDHDEALADPPPMIAPASCSNVLYMLNGMTEENGGTRIVPGSHMAGRHPDPERDKHVESIAAEGPPGCAIVTDGRVWHGTGANIGNSERTALILTYCGPQYRTQENYTVGLRPEVYERCSQEVKALFGFKVWSGYGRTADPTVEFISREDVLLGELRPR